MARLVLINGAPACGKSTLAQMYIDEHPLTLAIDIDVVRAMLGRWLDQPSSTLVDAAGQTQVTSGDTTVVNGGPLLVKTGREDITQQHHGMVHPGDPTFAYGWVIKPT